MRLVGWLTAMTKHHVLGEQLRRQTFYGSLTAWANGVTLMDHLSEALAGIDRCGRTRRAASDWGSLRRIEGEALVVTASEPGVVGPGVWRPLEDVLRDADISMHQAKSARRSSY